MRLFRSFSLSIFFIFFGLQGAHAKEVTLMIYLDFSGSMDDNRGKLAQLVPHITGKMQQACGSYRLATNNILYDDIDHNSYKPYGQPAFVTEQVSHGNEELALRILSPFSDAALSGDSSNKRYNIPSGDREITYSSISRSVVANLDHLRGEDMVAALIVTDAVPGFEYGSPEEELALIRRALGKTAFMAGSISVNLKNGTKLSDINSSCQPDMSGKLPARFQGTVLPKETQEWMGTRLEDLQLFTYLSGGASWDICDHSLESSIDDFLQMVFVQSGCMVLM